MNAKKLNQIKLEEILLVLGHFPSKISGTDVWYYNPFFTELNSSFKVSRARNQWYLFSEGIGGNNVDFLVKYFKNSVSDVLQWASEQNFSSFDQQSKISEPKYNINEVLPLTNWNLKKYLNSRGLSSKVHKYLNEVKFTMGSTKLYAIGFKNLSGGFELRNSFYKGSVLKKDISVINQNSASVCVFEGFLDAMSYIEITPDFAEDILVLNSISLVSKAKENLQKYDDIKLFLDNDKGGKQTTNSLLECFSNAENCSILYQSFNDLNEYLMQK
ncbi:toprim domain-containing protein [Soonwooa sp.]|uniref:toprim domain-containing protein n=1 Tax=Soonwooa sp. TaxID=1938592 RepID=UPI0028A224FC|nr:toprim domain-containing protein [Soonwooa sp.]